MIRKWGAKIVCEFVWNEDRTNVFHNLIHSWAFRQPPKCPQENEGIFFKLFFHTFLFRLSPLRRTGRRLSEVICSGISTMRTVLKFNFVASHMPCSRVRIWLLRGHCIATRGHTTLWDNAVQEALGSCWSGRLHSCTCRFNIGYLVHVPIVISTTKACLVMFGSSKDNELFAE